MLGPLFAFLSAACFGFNNASMRRGVVSSTVMQALAITVPVGVPLFAIATVISGQTDSLFAFRTSAYIWLALAGMFHFVWGRYCSYRAVKAMGGNLAAPVQNANLLVALALAVLWLGEELTVLKIVGVILIFVGPAVALPKRKKPAPAPRSAGAAAAAENEATASASTATARPAFEPKLLEGYTFALLSATGYGLSPIFVRLGLEGTGASLAGGLISYTAATVFFALFLIPKGRFAHVAAMDRRNLPWFLNSAVFVFFAQMFRYLGLAVAPVTVIAPIQRTSAIFRVVFTTLLNREHEVFEPRLVVGIIISFLGALALTLSVDFVATALGLPASVLNWQWP